MQESFGTIGGTELFLPVGKNSEKCVLTVKKVEKKPNPQNEETRLEFFRGVNGDVTENHCGSRTW